MGKNSINLDNLENLDLANISELAKLFDETTIIQEIKNIQSIKCNFKKKKTRSDYELTMTRILKKEQVLKEIKNYIIPKKVFVTNMSLEQIQDLNYDETIKAIKSIQSKKCNTQGLLNQSEYEKALIIEGWLLEHKNNLKPIVNTNINKSSIHNLINNLETLNKKVERDYVINELKKLLDK